jgi:hypothetical protein
MLLMTSPFVAVSGYCLTDRWFRRLDDFNNGVPGPVAPTSALATELRQRQILTVLSRGSDGRVTSDTQAASPGCGDGASHTLRLANRILGDMYDNAVAGPANGPLLRLFFADYIRWAGLGAVSRHTPRALLRELLRPPLLCVCTVAQGACPEQPPGVSTAACPGSWGCTL